MLQEAEGLGRHLCSQVTELGETFSKASCTPGLSLKLL